MSIKVNSGEFDQERNEKGKQLESEYATKEKYFRPMCKFKLYNLKILDMNNLQVVLNQILYSRSKVQLQLFIFHLTFRNLINVVGVS